VSRGVRPLGGTRHMTVACDGGVFVRRYACRMRVRVRRAHARRTAPCNQIARMPPQRRRWGLCGCTHATQRPSRCPLSMQHACTSLEGPRTTSGAVRAVKSHECRLSDRRRWGPCGCTHATQRPSTCHLSMRSKRVRVRRAHARRAAPCNQIARMPPQRRRWGPCGCTHATQRPSTCRLSMQHACTSAEGPRTTSGTVQSNRTNAASATPLGPVWVYARYPTTKYMSSVDAAHACTSAEGPRTTSGAVQSN
jgi:hypothetical protein